MSYPHFPANTPGPPWAYPNPCPSCSARPIASDCTSPHRSLLSPTRPYPFPPSPPPWPAWSASPPPETSAWVSSCCDRGCFASNTVSIFCSVTLARIGCGISFSFVIEVGRRCVRLQVHVVLDWHVAGWGRRTLTRPFLALGAFLLGRGGTLWSLFAHFGLELV